MSDDMDTHEHPRYTTKRLRYEINRVTEDLRSRLEAAEKERDELRAFVDEDKAEADKWRNLATVDGPANSYELWKDRAEAAEASLAKAIEVIRPFAEDAQAIHPDWANERRRASLTPSKSFTIGDLRKAAEFIKEIEG